MNARLFRGRSTPAILAMFSKPPASWFSPLSFEPRALSNPFLLAAHSSQLIAASSLSLLVFRILANHPHHTLAVDDLALVANFLHRCPYFHKPVLGRSSLVVRQTNPELLTASKASIASRSQLEAHSLFVSIHNPPAIQVVGRKLNRDFISRQN